MLARRLFTCTPDAGTPSAPALARRGSAPRRRARRRAGAAGRSPRGPSGAAISAAAPGVSVISASAAGTSTSSCASCGRARLVVRVAQVVHGVDERRAASAQRGDELARAARGVRASKPKCTWNTSNSWRARAPTRARASPAATTARPSSGRGGPGRGRAAGPGPGRPRGTGGGRRRGLRGPTRRSAHGASRGPTGRWWRRSGSSRDSRCLLTPRSPSRHAPPPGASAGPPHRSARRAPGPAGRGADAPAGEG